MEQGVARWLFAWIHERMEYMLVVLMFFVPWDVGPFRRQTNTGFMCFVLGIAVVKANLGTLFIPRLVSRKIPTDTPNKLASDHFLCIKTPPSRLYSMYHGRVCIDESQQTLSMTVVICDIGTASLLEKSNAFRSATAVAHTVVPSMLIC